MYKLVVFVPETHVEKVKNALFSKGAGQSAHYSHCCWQTAGEMQYLPLAGSDPAVGHPGELVKTKDYRVEMVCEQRCLTQVIAELKRVHPYEEPAYELYKLEQLN